ncbi:hypothetical protein L1987_74963 [Smallanthus sonchifolius]|uniref:Uncharacterized protein n=1 Tax=Smallanthus sonchifolius TaxID=185202 RepID=A0ACB9A414_9ASTR|nr:hypothetical protein L1987_74963 [Smallanthus sonchifolius]
MMVLLPNFRLSRNAQMPQPFLPPKLGFLIWVLSRSFGRSTVAEHVAAGWPAWLSAVAGEAIDGWIPQKSDSFERLEKVYRHKEVQ